MYHAYSTMSTDVAYTFYSDTKVNDLPEVLKTIVVAGGANVAKKNLETPRGVITSLSDEDAELLSTHPVFQRHQKNGFVVLDKSRRDPEKVSAAQMEAADKSAPLTDADFSGDDDPKPTTKKSRKK